MELQILHAIQGIHQEWLTEILRFFTTMGESGLVWIVIAIVLTCIPKTRKCGLTMMIAMAVTYLVGNLFLREFTFGASLLLRLSLFWMPYPHLIFILSNTGF